MKTWKKNPFSCGPCVISGPDLPYHRDVTVEAIGNAQGEGLLRAWAPCLQPPGICRKTGVHPSALVCGLLSNMQTGPSWNKEICVHAGGRFPDQSLHADCCRELRHRRTPAACYRPTAGLEMQYVCWERHVKLPFGAGFETEGQSNAAIFLEPCSNMN